MPIFKQSAFKTDPRKRALNMTGRWKCEVIPCQTLLKFWLPTLLSDFETPSDIIRFPKTCFSQTIVNKKDWTGKIINFNERDTGAVCVASCFLWSKIMNVHTANRAEDYKHLVLNRSGTLTQPNEISFDKPCSQLGLLTHDRTSWSSVF